MAVEETLLTGGDVARRLGISKAKAFYLIQRGLIPSAKLDRNVRVRQQDVEKYIRQSLQNESEDRH